MLAPVVILALEWWRGRMLRLGRRLTVAVVHVRDGHGRSRAIAVGRRDGRGMGG